MPRSRPSQADLYGHELGRPAKSSRFAETKPDTQFECHHCHRRYEIRLVVRSGGLFDPTWLAMVLTTRWDSIEEADAASLCRPCMKQKGPLDKARPVSNVLGEFRLNGLDWPVLPETEEFVERRAVVQKLDDWDVSEYELAEILDRLFEDFDNPAVELAARIVGLPDDANDIDKLVRVVDIARLLASDGDELVLELKQPDSLAPRVPETDGLERIEQLHANGVHVVGGMPELPATEEQSELPLIPIELDC